MIWKKPRMEIHKVEKKINRQKKLFVEYRWKYWFVLLFFLLFLFFFHYDMFCVYTLFTHLPCLILCVGTLSTIKKHDVRWWRKRIQNKKETVHRETYIFSCRNLKTVQPSCNGRKSVKTRLCKNISKCLIEIFFRPLEL